MNHSMAASVGVPSVTQFLVTLKRKEKIYIDIALLVTKQSISAMQKHQQQQQYLSTFLVYTNLATVFSNKETKNQEKCMFSLSLEAYHHSGLTATALIDNVSNV